MRLLARGALAAFFVSAGAVHFLRPAPYLAIMPRFLPWPAALVAASGAVEIIGGLGVIFPRSRRAAGWGLIALLIAVFPANLQAIANGMSIGGWRVPAWLLWVRLPFQGFFVAWVYAVCLRAKASS
ncbi:MAG: DoxX family protein [Chthoniobacterales bacterium]